MLVCVNYCNSSNQIYLVPKTEIPSQRNIVFSISYRYSVFRFSVHLVLNSNLHLHSRQNIFSSTTTGECRPMAETPVLTLCGLRWPGRLWWTYQTEKPGQTFLFPLIFHLLQSLRILHKSNSMITFSKKRDTQAGETFQICCLFGCFEVVGEIHLDLLMIFVLQTNQ